MSQYLVTPPIVTRGLVWYTDPGNYQSLPVRNAPGISYLGTSSMNDLSGNNYITPFSSASNFIGNLFYPQYGGYIDYTNGAAYVTSSSTNLTNLSTATWCMWLNIETGSQVIMFKNDNNSSAGWVINQGTTAVNTQYDGIGIQIVAPTNLRAYVTSSLVPTNTWYNLIIAWGGTLTSPIDTKIYFNGVLMPLYYTVNGAGSRTSDASYATIICSSVNSGIVSSGIRTYLGPAMIYNRALSQAEVVQNYNAQKSRFGLT